ncbi:fungal-specific transcription factor domain-containing protein [Phialemonium atrogriseum]|uniref:Fungal-specific transcription factor domain-containing protein n=1 Tax=Phialemonium atrogriseum TaxID=1093897 RepID=A0AAJ0BX87_9PEZI|nr:fungal-specific transcription factor domain-containing protein [Phialemonium atrogriseum]KAK1764752.1 fungal-specific transcription factor domain-containing protein [Phialemonium atrogriseum]
MTAVSAELTCPMAAKARSAGGCWTCRLRRKKCDEGHPICGICAGLEIECLYSDTKPDWMDGAEKQKEKAGHVKAQVKAQAKHHARVRGEKHTLQTQESQGDHAASDDAVATPPSTGGPASSSGASTSNGTPYGSGTDSWMPDTAMTGLTPDSLFGLTLGANSFAAMGTSTSSTASMPNESEFSLIMLYLDYLFPFLNPFYTPRLLDGGRGWLLVVLMRNKALFHTALSLATYVFSVALYHDEGSPQQCKNHSSEELPKQQELSMRELQADIQELNRRGVKGYMKESTQVMSSIVQLLLFEVAVGNTGNWQIHLDASSALFEQIMEHHGSTEDGFPCWHLLLIHLGNGATTRTLLTQNIPWNADQASLRYFTASILFFDVLSATALEQPPRLQKYHQHLLTTPEHSCVEDDTHLPSHPHLDMAEFFGLENWIILSISSIAVLDAWKKDMMRSNSLSMAQLVTRASSIELGLRSRIPTLDQSPSRPPPDALDPLLESCRRRLAATAAASTRAATARVWAYAALTYLAVVVNGWQPRGAEIRESVALTLSTLRDLPSPASLRTVVWPLCVTGCVAGEEERDSIREMVAAMGPVKAFGTMTEAMAIMEALWADGGGMGDGAGGWDVAACLRSLGHPALLI